MILFFFIFDYKENTMASNKSTTPFLFATVMVILVVFCGINEARHMEDSHYIIESERHMKTSYVVNKYLGYGDLGRDRAPGCSLKNPKECLKDVANHFYNRGCELINRCRHDP